MKCGDRVIVVILGDDRELAAVYLGVVAAAVDRPHRRIYAVDDGTADGWKLLVEPTIKSVRPAEP